MPCIETRKCFNCRVSIHGDFSLKAYNSVKTQQRSEIFLGVNQGTKYYTFMKKNKDEISCYCPFKYLGSDKNEYNMDCRVYKATGVGVQEANLTILHSVGPDLV